MIFRTGNVRKHSVVHVRCFSAVFHRSHLLLMTAVVYCAIASTAVDANDGTIPEIPIIKQLQGMRLVKYTNSNRTAWLMQIQNSSGKWSPVCVNGPPQLSAGVACHQFGYITGGYAKEFLSSESDDNIRSTSDSTMHVNCTGFERSLDECWITTELQAHCERLLLIHCSDDIDIYRTVRLVNTSNDSTTINGILEVYDQAEHKWSDVCSEMLTLPQWRFICYALGMALKDFKNEALKSWLLNYGMKYLNCSDDATCVEDCRLESMKHYCSSVSYVTCTGDSESLQPVVFLGPHVTFDMKSAINITGISEVDIDVKTCSGLKIALANNRDIPMHDYTELEFEGPSEIHLRHCISADSCIFLDTIPMAAMFKCDYWRIIRMKFQSDVLILGVMEAKDYKRELLGEAPDVAHKYRNISLPYEISVLLITSTSHALGYRVTRGIKTTVSDKMNTLCNTTVLVLMLAPQYTKERFLIAVIMQCVSANAIISVDFGDGTIKQGYPKKLDGSIIPNWITKQVRSQDINGAYYISEFNHIYNNPGNYIVSISVSDRGPLKPPFHHFVNETIEVKTVPLLKEHIGLFILLNNGPTCAKCTITLQVLSFGLTNDYNTTVNPGDGSGSWIIKMQDRGANLPHWVSEQLMQKQVLLPLESFHSGNLIHSYNRPGQFRAVATINDENDFISTISIVIIDLLPHLPSVIGTVALFNSGPVYQHQNVDLVLIIEYLTRNAEVSVSDGIQILFSHLKPVTGQSIPAWVRDEVAAYPTIGNRTDCPTLKLQHSFASSGAHILEARISDTSYDDIVTAHTQVIVLQLPCDDRELHIRGGGGLIREHALKLRQRDFLRLHIEINLDCNITGVIVPAWTVTHFDALTSDPQSGKQIQLPPEANVMLQELYLPPFSLDIGYYLFHFQMTIPTNTKKGYITAYNQSWILMTFSPHLNHLRVGLLRNVLGLDSVTMIAISQLLEIENEHVHTSDQNPTCTWFCVPENIPVIDLDSLLTNNYSFPESGGCFGTGIKLPQNDPVFVFKADQLVYDKTSLPSKFKFHVVVTGLKHETLSATHELALIADYDPQLRIMCISNCNRTYNTSQELVLEATCVKNCNPGEMVKYEWKFSPASTKNFIQDIAWKTETNASLTSYLIIKANAFPKEAQGQSYSFIAIATKNNGLIGSELQSVNIPLEAKALESSATMYYLVCFKGLMTFILTIILHHTLLDYITPMD